MAVMIDIPGVGTVEAKNAASESTLQEILKALKGKTGGGTAGSAAGSAGGGAAGAAGAGSGAAGASTAGLKLFKAFNLLGKGVGVVTGTVGLLKTGVQAAAGAAVGLGEASTNAALSLSRLDGSASGIADMFGGIPLVGTVFKAVAAASDDVVKSYNAVSSVGATFGGSIQSFSKSASEAGMAMDQFASLIKSNGEAMGAFGVTTEDGAKRFGQVSKALRTTSSDLYALGFSTQEINQGLASYGKTLRLQGHQGKQTNAELAAGAKNYLKEMDMLAKVTGQERAAKEKEREALMVDGMFRAAMAGLGPEVENSVATMIQSMPSKELQDFAKDLIANGTATTEANRKLMSQQPQLAAQLTALHKQTQSNVAVSKEQMNQTLNTGKVEGMAALQRSKTALAASEEWQGTAAAMGAWNKVNLDGVKIAGEQQEESKKNTDKFNEKMQAMQQRIAEVSNTFKGILANTGILDILMNAFEMVAKVAETYLVPVFNIVASTVQKLWAGFELTLAPVIDFLSGKLGAEGLGGTVEWIDSFLGTAFDVLGGFVRGAILAFEGLWDGVSMMIDPLKELWYAIVGTTDFTSSFGETLIDVGKQVGAVLRFLGEVMAVTVIPVLTWIAKEIRSFIIAIVDAATWVYNLGDKFRDFADGLGSIIDSILNALPSMMGGISDEEKARRDAARAAEKAERDQSRENAKYSKEADAQRHKEALKEDKKEFNEKKVTHEKLTAAAKKEADVKEAAVKANEKLMDYNSGPEALLKAFSAKEGGLVEKGVKKEELEKQISAAQADVESAKTEAAKKAAAEKVLALQTQMGAIDNPKGASSDFAETAKALGSTSSTSKPAALGGEATKKEIEAEAEKKKAEAAKKAEEYKKEEEAAKREFEKENKKPATTQESAETLLAQLNTNMAELIKLTKDQKEIGERQLTVQKSLTGDLFAAV